VVRKQFCAGFLSLHFSAFDFQPIRGLMMASAGGGWHPRRDFRMETLLPIIVQVVTGIVGGQAVGAALQQAAMSQLPKLLGGAIGGVGGAAILGSLLHGGAVDPAAATAAASGLGSALNLNNIVGGAGGGAILTGVIGMVMNAMKK
jgi:hypothetical protein